MNIQDDIFMTFYDSHDILNKELFNMLGSFRKTIVDFDLHNLCKDTRMLTHGVWFHASVADSTTCAKQVCAQQNVYQ